MEPTHVIRSLFCCRVTHLLLTWWWRTGCVTWTQTVVEECGNDDNRVVPETVAPSRHPFTHCVWPTCVLVAVDRPPP